MFKKILVPTDGSGQANKALDLACKMAMENDQTQINILSVFRHHSFTEASLSMLPRQIDDEAANLDEVMRAYAKELVAKAKELAIEYGLEKHRVRGFIRVGQVAKEILDFIKEEDVDLIVIGKQGRGDLSGYLLGGVSHKVTGLSKIPVMVI
ncbi:universal stress protein [Arcobacter arenosus]|uniref:universal stress protein n=1 Tax=Arcobacter arenosus TaxID=2576037 RepID=UPI003BAC26DA